MKSRLLCVIIFMIFLIVGCASMPEYLKPAFPSDYKSKDEHHQYVKSDDAFTSEDEHHQYVESDDAFESVEGESKMPEALMPEEQMKQSMLLGNAKRDMEAYRLYAKHLHQHNEFDDLEILEDASDSYIKQYADELLKQETSHPDYETIRLSVVILFTKAMLLYEFNQMDEVDSVMEELKTNYSQYYDIAVNHFGYKVIRETIEKFEGRSKERKKGGTGKAKPSGKKAAPIKEEGGFDPGVEEYLDDLKLGYDISDIISL